MGIGHEDRGHPVGGELEHRAAGAGERQIGGVERLSEALHVEVLEQVVAGRQLALGQLGIVAGAADVEHVEGRRGESLDRGEVDRAGPQRAPEDQHARRLRGDAKAPRAAPRVAGAAGTGRPVTR